MPAGPVLSTMPQPVVRADRRVPVLFRFSTFHIRSFCMSLASLKRPRAAVLAVALATAMGGAAFAPQAAYAKAPAADVAGRAPGGGRPDLPRRAWNLAARKKAAAALTASQPAFTYVNVINIHTRG